MEPEVAAPATRPPSPKFLVLALGGAAVAVAIAFLIVYPHLGFDADSVAYLGVARNIAAGHGITYPFSRPGARMTDFPPGYPLLLAAADTAGFSITQFAHVFQGLMLGVAASLAAYLVIRASASIPFAALAFVLVAVAPGLAETFSVLYSEPLAIVLQLGALVFLAVWAANRKVPYLVAAGACAAVAPVVRWAGVSVIVVGVIALLVYAAGGIGRRFGLAAVWGGTCLVPALLVDLANRNAGNGGSGTARELAWHPIDWPQIKVGLETVGAWFLPSQVQSRWVAGFALVVVAIGLIVAFVVRRGVSVARSALERAGPAVVIPALFVVVYAVFLLLSISLIDAATPLDARLLSPLYAAAVPAVIGGIAVWYAHAERRPELVGAVLVVGAVAIALVGIRAVSTATGSQDYRLGYAAARWHRSPVMQYVESLPRREWVVTNAPEAVYVRTDRHARKLPSKYSSTSLAQSDHYAEDLTAMIDRARAHDGIIAMFDAVRGRLWLAKAPELERDSRLRVVKRLDDGVVLAPSD